MYRRLFLLTCLVVISLLIGSGAMAQEPTAPEQGAENPQLDSPTPDEAYSVDASMGTAFTYQGRIKKDGSLVSGTCNMAFSLWDAATGGTQQGTTQSVASVSINDGLFTVQLNGGGQFGSSAFNGQKRHLEISIECPPASSVTLIPRQELAPAPYAIHALHASTLYAADGNPQNAVYVDVEGRVGIGTTGPFAPLQVLGGATDANGGALVVGAKNTANLRLGWHSDYTWIQSHMSKPLAINPLGNNVGIGTNTPSAKLDVAGNGIRLKNADKVLDLQADGVDLNIESNRPLWINGRTEQNTYINRSGGRVGIGTANPQAKLDVAGGGIRLKDADKVLDLQADGADLNIESNRPLWINGRTEQNTYINRNGGNVGIGTSSPKAKLDVAGWTRTDVLQIDAGADLAEPFVIAGQPEPGRVVAIDPDHIGQLRIADQPYDRKVAGVISGAGGLQPGLTMQQPEIVQGEASPVALTGRVYVWADASFGAIQPGDLLTTSATPGHAMKVSDHERAQGAVLGKAMGRLEKGQGLVLVLVTLQ